tara:strand:+ start:864 stop:1091 length:228 start_codon:yes stop_codon:yes gene_type:complete
MALNMKKETTEKIANLSECYISEMIKIIQKTIEEKVDELDTQFDNDDRAADRRVEIREVVCDMVNDGDITVNIEA